MNIVNGRVTSERPESAPLHSVENDGYGPNHTGGTDLTITGIRSYSPGTRKGRFS